MEVLNRGPSYPFYTNMFFFIFIFIFYTIPNFYIMKFLLLMLENFHVVPPNGDRTSNSLNDKHLAWLTWSCRMWEPPLKLIELILINNALNGYLMPAIYHWPWQFWHRSPEASVWLMWSFHPIVIHRIRDVIDSPKARDWPQKSKPADDDELAQFFFQKDLLSSKQVCCVQC